MKINRLISFFALLPFLSKAQQLSFNQYEMLRSEELKVSATNLDNQYDDIKGTAFFSPQWLPATAISEKGAQYTGLKIKFDIYKNKFFANTHDTLYDLSSAHIARFTLYPNGTDTTTSYIFQKGFSSAGIRPEQYVQVLAAGKLTLLKLPTLEVKEVSDESPLSKVKKFIGQDYYYLIARDGQGMTVHLNKKTLEKEMADKFSDVSRYAKEKALSFNEEDGWIPLVKYYNSLN